MQNHPVVSVVLPAYNCEKTISAAVRSALAQTVPDLELIVVNDGSCDRTATLVAGLAERESRLIFLDGAANRGVAAARNWGCSIARGKYVAFLDSDDLWVERKLEKQLELMETHGCGLSYTGYGMIDQAGRQMRRAYQVPELVTYQGLLKENVIGCSTVVVRRELLGSTPFDSRYFHEDYVLWLRLLRQGHVARGIAERLAWYRFGGRSQKKGRAACNRWKVYREAEGLGWLRSVYYFGWYSVRALKKHRCY